MSLVTLGATYDSTDLVSVVDGYPRLMWRCVRGLDELWQTRGRDTVIPGTAGRTVRSRVRDRLAIELEGWLLGVGDTEAEQLADVRAALETFRTLFDPTRAAATLSVALEEGGTADILARPVNVIWRDDPAPVFREGSIQLEAVGSDWTVTLAGS